MANSIVSRVSEIATPAAEGLGLEIWDITYKKEGSEYILCVYIDKEGGVTMDDCVNMTHAISKPLDEADMIDHSYSLQVSSPGIERELKKKEHFEKYIGSPVTIKTIRPVDGVRDFAGTLRSYEDGKVTIEQSDGSMFTVEKKDTAHIKLDDFDMADFEKELNEID